jgi:hypothetical protein
VGNAERLLSVKSMRWRPSVVTIAGIAAGIGLLPMPYGYYALLRFFFCGVALYYLSQPSGVSDVEKWVLVGLAVLFNPIVPIELGNRFVWAAVSVGAVGYFWLLARRRRGARGSRWLR